MSSGGLWFALLVETPPVLKACWRLALTALLQLPLFLREAAAMPAAAPATAAFRRRWRAHLPIMGVAGAFLAVHFGAWSWSVSHTSLTHSLLLVSTTPLIMVGALALRHAASRALAAAWPQPPRVGSAAADGENSPPASAAAGRGGAGVDAAAAGADACASAPQPQHAAVHFSRSGVANTESDGEQLVGTASDGAIAGGNALSFSSAADADAAVAADVPGNNSDASAKGLSPEAALRRLLAPAASLPPTALEAAGSLVSFAAAALLVLSAGGSHAAAAIGPEVTVQGDLMAVLGAATVWLYLEVGGSLRAWMPLFHYAFPVTLASALAAAVLSFLFEPSVTLVGASAASLLGFLGSPARFALAFGAALCSGMLGHTLMNLSLARISPLVVAVCALSEPLLGSVLGFLVGVQGVPDPITLVCGPLLVAGCVLTTLGARDAKVDAAAWLRRRCGGSGDGS
jgi:drug/metabolite transporter (DMT)-like permease